MNVFSKFSKAMPLLAPVLVVWLLAAGCGGSENQARAGDRELTVGYVGYADSVAIAKLTQAVMEQELGYDVELRRFDDPEAAILAAADGKVDTFQNVWMPEYTGYVGEAKGERLLNPWLVGTTRSGLAAPSYMDVGSVDGMKRYPHAPIISVEPGVGPGSKVAEAVADQMTDRKIFYRDTSTMLSTLQRRYSDGENFFFTAWSPHWMNQEYQFEYLIDPGDELGGATQPSRIQPVVNGKLGEEDPFALAFVDALQLSDNQISTLELSIWDAKNPREGVESWVEDRDWLAQSWIGATKRQIGED